MLVRMSAAHPGLPALRIGVGVAVPVLALSAHGIAHGELPGAAGILICVALGAVLAGMLDARAGTRQRDRRPSVASVAALLVVGQVVGHFAASVGDAGHGVADLGAVGPMAAWHSAAIPLSAVLVVLVAHLYALVSSVVESLTTAPVLPVGGRRAAVTTAWRPRAATLRAGGGSRAPPFSTT